MDTTMIELMYIKDRHDLKLEEIMILPDPDCVHVTSRLMTLPETRPTCSPSSESLTINVAFTFLEVSTKITMRFRADIQNNNVFTSESM